MAKLTTPRLLFGGTGGGVGKSLLTLGIAQELRRDSMSVSCLMTAPHLTQALLLRRALGRYVGIIDSQLLSAPQIAATVLRAAFGADIILIDGTKGLIDGSGAQLVRGSDAELATLLNIPTVVVSDVSQTGATVGATSKGLEAAVQGLDIVAHLWNRAPLKDGSVQEDLYRQVATHHKLKPLYGIMPELAEAHAIPKLWATQRENVVGITRQFFVDLSTSIRKNIDLDRLMVCAGDADVVQLPEIEINPAPRRCRIAVADDPCFGVSFQDNFDLLRLFGAEIVPFSPLADSRLPGRIGAVYLGGGMLRDYAQDLAANQPLREALRNFADSGGVIYAEGAGTIYLCDTFQLAQQQGVCEGLGIIPAHAVEGKSGWGYCQTVTIEESVIGRSGMLMRGILPDDWKIVREDKVVKVARLSRGRAAGTPEGYSPTAQIYATLALNHFGANPEVAKNLVEATEVNSKLTAPPAS